MYVTDRNWYAVGTCRSDESKISFDLSNLYSSEEPDTGNFCYNKNNYIILHLESYQLIFFEVGVMIGTTELYSLVSV